MWCFPNVMVIVFCVLINSLFSPLERAVDELSVNLKD